MQIVGLEILSSDSGQVHTLDVWFSERRGLWVVERLDAAGDQVGFATTFAEEIDALACVASWLRAHGEAYLVAPTGPRRTSHKDLAPHIRRAA